MAGGVDAAKADYLLIGAGAAGMAFADTLLGETDATLAIVDRNHRPGGHWNHAYPFVRLHQPSAFYGVNSTPLGSDRIDTQGLNQGFYELASGAEITAYFERIMRERFLPSGRVQYFPVSEYKNGEITNLISGQSQKARARKFVDATKSNTTVPSRRPPQYAVAPGVTCAPVNDLPLLARAGAAYVIVGAGKTAIDACCWLLEHGADPDAITWIMPRDSWLLNRKNYQAGPEFFAQLAESLANQVEAIATASSIDDLCQRLEHMGEWSRIDPAVQPTAFHCAIVSDAELMQLRRIKNVVRQGRAKRIERNQIQLEHGSVPSAPDAVYIDCSAPGIPDVELCPIFQGEKIVLQWIRLCQPTFSAAFIAHVEATYDDDKAKNQFCGPVPTPQQPADYLRMMMASLANRLAWSTESDLLDWLAAARLDGLEARTRAAKTQDPRAAGHLKRFAENVKAAIVNGDQLLRSL